MVSITTAVALPAAVRTVFPLWTSRYGDDSWHCDMMPAAASISLPKEQEQQDSMSLRNT